MFRPGLAINAATTRRQWSLLEAIDAYARLGVAAIAPWRDHLHAEGAQRVATALRTAGLPVSGRQLDFIAMPEPQHNETARRADGARKRPDSLLMTFAP